MRRLPLIPALLGGLALSAALALTTPACAQLYVGKAQARPPIQILAPVTSPVNFGQGFNVHASCAALTGAVGFVWSDNLSNEVSACGAVRGVLTSTYAPGWRGLSTDWPSGHNLAWYYANHPDWIMYVADRATPAWAFSDTTYVPLDITNSAVSSYLGDQALGIMFPGNGAISLDNITEQNFTLAAGHYVGQSIPCTPPVGGAAPSCGGTWVTTFAGSNALDPAWTAAMQNFINLFRQRVNAAGFPLIINNDWDYHGNSNLKYQDQLEIAALADGVLSEGYPLNGDVDDDSHTDGRPTNTGWDKTYAYAVEASKGFHFMFAYNHLGMAGATESEAAWMVAGYLLVRQNAALNFLSVSSQYNAASDNGHLVSYPAYMNPQIGTPTEDPPATDCRSTGSGLCVRHFTGGIVVVNGNDTADKTFTVPAGSHTDQFGHTVTAGSRTVSAHTAIVIVGPPS